MTPALTAKIEAFLQESPDNQRRLELFLHTSTFLVSTADVMAMTGWSQAYVTRLCRKKALPHIPGNPNKFVLSSLIEAIKQMQVGGARL